MEINNIESLSENYIWKDKAGLITKFLGESAGSRNIYVNIDYVPANAYSTKYHSHSRQEEFFLVLSGAGTLRLNGIERTVSTGDFIAKPAGQNIAHTFYNSGNEVLTILDVGTIVKEDTCYYPDEDMYLHKSNEQRMAFSGSDLNQSWSSDPN